jgi:hypothetical protein
MQGIVERYALSFTIYAGKKSALRLREVGDRKTDAVATFLRRTASRTVDDVEGGAAYLPMSTSANHGLLLVSNFDILELKLSIVITSSISTAIVYIDRRLLREGQFLGNEGTGRVYSRKQEVIWILNSI